MTIIEERLQNMSEEEIQQFLPGMLVTELFLRRSKSCSNSP